MKKRTLGREGLEVSAIGLGCMGMSQGYGTSDDAESIATLQRALDLGVTFWDTAQSYGAGHNEQLLARAFKGRREQVQLATKFGIVRGPDGVKIDGRPEGVRTYCEASLERLGTDYIDLYYLHRVDPQVPIEETVGAMADLVAQGKVKHLAVSECNVEQLERAASVHTIAALQCEWSLWWREPEDDVIQVATRLGIGIVPYSPLGRGFLTSQAPPDAFGPGDFRAGDARFSGQARQRNLVVMHAVERLASQLGATPAQLALAWLLTQGNAVVPIPGTRHAHRLMENARATSVTLTPADRASIEAVAGRAAWSGDRRSFAAQHTQRRPV